MATNKKGDIIRIIKQWASTNYDVEEVLIFGSQSKVQSDDYLIINSDIDIMIITSELSSTDSLLRELLEIGVKFDVLIHPLIITENDRSFKLGIKEYQDAYNQGQFIYKKREKNLLKNKLFRD